ncbi:MAG: NAD(P)-dependent alcohol dehydrogenase, partial [Vulcanimicrobiaceae bacterium]
TRIGERVVGVVFARWLDGPFAYDRAEQLGGSLDGMLAEYVVLDADAALPVPAHLSDDEAATLPCAGVTAWNALTGGSALLPGATVLTQGTGGVALFALQFAKLFGARVIATTSAPDKAELLRHLGADEVVDYRAVPEWDRVVRTWTNGLGVDHAIDVGGTATWARTVASTAASGEVALVGSVGGASAAYDPIVLRRAAATLRSVALGSRAHAVAMHRAIAAHGLRPVIDRVFAFDEAVEAYRYFATPRPPGKVVIRVA